MPDNKANNGPKGAANSFVKFTKPAAVRIAKAVRVVEAGNRDQQPISPPHYPETFRLRAGTYTGSWGINQVKVITFSATTNTVSVTNFCVAVADNGTTPRSVFFARSSGTNAVVEINPNGTCSLTSFGGQDMRVIAGYSSGSIQILGHNSTGPCMQWYSIATCATT